MQTGPDLCASIRGRTIRIRPIAPEDAPRLVAGLQRLSPASRRARFFFNKTGFSTEELWTLTHCDGVTHAAYVAELADESECPLIAVARWIRDREDPSLADVAYVTRDDWQGCGVGSAVLRELARSAARQGVTALRAQILTGNAAALRLLAHAGEIEERDRFGAEGVEYLCRLDAADGGGSR